METSDAGHLVATVAVLAAGERMRWNGPCFFLGGLQSGCPFTLSQEIIA
jgi:hypothetical protein